MRATSLRWAALTWACAAASAQAEQLLWQSFDPNLGWMSENGPVVVFNGSGLSRHYVVRDADRYIDHSRRFRLPAGAACRLDRKLMLQPTKAQPLFRASGQMDGVHKLGDFVEDVSDGYVEVMNGPYVRHPPPYACREGCEAVMELLNCSSADQPRCAAGRWGSWQVGLKFGASYRKEYGCQVFSTQACVIDFSGGQLYWPQMAGWGQGAGIGPSPFALRYERSWNKALVLIQGGLAGQGFNMDPYAALDDSQTFAAPYCSAFIIDASGSSSGLQGWR